jgi:hypothetical protein
MAKENLTIDTDELTFTVQGGDYSALDLDDLDLDDLVLSVTSADNYDFIADDPYGNAIEYKFDEDMYLEEIFEYIKSTYDQHYAKDKFQATEFIIDGGHGTGFCVGNMLKYSQRYGKKGTADDARKDIIKVIHYALIQLYVHDNEL